MMVVYDWWWRMHFGNILTNKSTALKKPIQRLHLVGLDLVASFLGPRPMLFPELYPSQSGALFAASDESLARTAEVNWAYWIFIVRPGQIVDSSEPPAPISAPQLI